MSALGQKQTFAAQKGSPDRMNDLRNQGERTAENWLDKWHEDKASSYPEDAGYYKREG